MESTEEESREKHPSLPPNYVSLAQLQERWLQRQKQKQEIEDQKGKQEQEQPKPEGKLIIASQSQRQEKGKKKFCEKEQGRERNGWRRVEGHRKVYMPKHVLDGKRPEISVAERQLKSEEFKVGALAHPGVDRVGGKEGKIVSWKRKEKNWTKRVARVKGSLIGGQGNGGNLGASSRRNVGEEGCREDFGGNGTRDREVEGKVSVCMVRVVPENKGKEVTLVGMGGKCGGDKGFGEQDWGNSDHWRLGESSTMVEELPEKGSGKEVPVAENGDDQGMLEAGSVCMVELLPENKVEEDCSVNVWRKRGEGSFRARYQRNVDNLRKWRVSRYGKMELGCEKNVVDKGVFMKEDERSGDHKGRTARWIQACGDKEMVSGSLLPKITRDLRSLSLDESRVGNVALRRGQHGWQQRRYENSRDVNGLVWKKKG